MTGATGRQPRIDRVELADFLRSHRCRLSPAQAGLAVRAGEQRRVPGLRREEVAQLAGMSADYYTRLEQRRGPHPSPGVLDAVARALRLSPDERDHLHHLTGSAPPRRPSAPRSTPVGPVLRHLLDRLDDLPALVVDDLTDVLAVNRMATLLLPVGAPAASGPHAGNLLWGGFTDPAWRACVPEEDWERLARSHVADLRATAARRRGDPDVEALVRDLRAASPQFRRLWAEHAVEQRIGDAKRIRHPEVGVLHLDCTTLLSGADGHHLVVFSPTPGSGAREQLDLLRAVGVPRAAGAAATVPVGD